MTIPGQCYCKTERQNFWLQTCECSKNKIPPHFFSTIKQLKDMPKSRKENATNITVMFILQVNLNQAEAANISRSLFFTFFLFMNLFFKPLLFGTSSCLQYPTTPMPHFSSILIFPNPCNLPLPSPLQESSDSSNFLYIYTLNETKKARKKSSSLH